MKTIHENVTSQEYGISSEMVQSHVWENEKTK